MSSSGAYRLHVAGLVFVFCGCSDAGEAIGDGAGGGRPGLCAAGERPQDDGQCVPAGLGPELPCAPGERARNDGRCVPAGVSPEDCAEGFVHDGDRACEPRLPEASCPDGQLALPGESQCREVAPCAAGTWGSIPVEVDTQYVNGAYGGGDSDGTSGRPWTTVQAGVDAAPPGAIVAVAAGTYDEHVAVGQGKAVRLWGRCPAEVTIRGSASAPATILATASGTEIRDLAVTGATIGIGVAAGSVLLDRVWIHDTSSIGFAAEGAAEATLRGVLVERATRGGIVAHGTTVVVDASAVRATRVQDGYGIGVFADAGANAGARADLTVQGTLIEGSAFAGVCVSGADARVLASVVRDTTATAGPAGGIWIEAATGGNRASATVRASLVEHSDDNGIIALASDVTVESTVIRHGRMGPSLFGAGFTISRDPTASTERAVGLLRGSLIERSVGMGVLVYGSELMLEGAAIRDTQPNEVGQFGRGIDIEELPSEPAPATASIVDSWIERSVEVGVLVAGSTTTITRTAIRDTSPTTAGNLGRGITLQTTAINPDQRWEVRSSLIEQNQGLGIAQAGGSSLIEAVEIRDTLPDANGSWGRAINLQARPGGERAGATLRSVRIEGSHDAGVFLAAADALIEFSAIIATYPNSAEQFGDGVAMLTGGLPDYSASVILRDTRIEASARAGLSNFGASAELSGMDFECNAIDIDGEAEFGGSELAPTFTDRGNNRCGCGEAVHVCGVQSASLDPPGLPEF